jgi:hypothetical protein
MEREKCIHICVVQVFCSFNLYILHSIQYCQYTVLFIIIIIIIKFVTNIYNDTDKQYT